MKNTFVLSLLVSILCLATVSGLADTPPFPMSLSTRVNSATHVFVGKAKKVTFVRYSDTKTGKVEKVKPEPKVSGSGSGGFFEIEVEVQEVLFPALWKSSKTVKVHFGGGKFSIKEFRESITKNIYIYVMTAGSSDGEVIFRPYGWDLVEELKVKEKIKDLLEKRVKMTAQSNNSMDGRQKQRR